MAEHIVKMPRLGESVTEGTVAAWFKSVGDRVEFDEPLFEVSTDKVDSEIPSPFEGQILEILVPVGDTVPVDTALVRIGEPGEATAPVGVAAILSAAAPATAAPAMAPAPGAAAVAPSTSAVPAPVTGPRPAAHPNGGRSLLSPIVRRLATEGGVDLTAVAGSGEGGRIMREDVEAVLAARAVAIPAAPVVSVPAEVAMPAIATSPVAAARADERSETVALSRIRVLIGENMGRSLAISPHVWTSVEVDLEAIEQIRQAHKERFRKDNGVSLTYLPFIARAVCDGLRRFPAINSSVDMETKTMTLHHYVNLGIAVDLDEQGLVVPVVKGADALNLRGLARTITAKATAARNRTLPPDELSGSTFTITNPGPMGDYASAPIINQPNVAILSTNQVARRPTVEGNFVAIHHMTILGLSYDHRAFDGVTASRFLAYVRDALQDRQWEAELQ